MTNDSAAGNKCSSCGTEAMALKRLRGCEEPTTAAPMAQASDFPLPNVTDFNESSRLDLVLVDDKNCNPPRQRLKVNGTVQHQSTECTELGLCAKI